MPAGVVRADRVDQDHACEPSAISASKTRPSVPPSSTRTPSGGSQPLAQAVDRGHARAVVAAQEVPEPEHEQVRRCVHEDRLVVVG